MMKKRKFSLPLHTLQRNKRKNLLDYYTPKPKRTKRKENKNKIRLSPLSMRIKTLAETMALKSPVFGSYLKSNVSSKLTMDYI